MALSFELMLVVTPKKTRKTDDKSSNIFGINLTFFFVSGINLTFTCVNG